MNFYKLSTISICLLIGSLLACSPNKQQAASSKVIQNMDETTSQGMKVYIDPNTKKFLDAPPEGSIPTNKKTVTTNIKDKNNLNSSQSQKTPYEEKISPTPGGGTYINMPPP